MKDLQGHNTSKTRYSPNYAVLFTPFGEEYWNVAFFGDLEDLGKLRELRRGDKIKFSYEDFYYWHHRAPSQKEYTGCKLLSEQ